jgi:hypothetical protein
MHGVDGRRHLQRLCGTRGRRPAALPSCRAHFDVRRPGRLEDRNLHLILPPGPIRRDVRRRADGFRQTPE